MRNVISCAERVADAMTQANAASVQEGEERGVAGEEEFLADVDVLWGGFGEREVGEEVGDCSQGEAFGGDFAGEGVVKEFDCVVEGADLRGLVYCGGF